MNLSAALDQFEDICLTALSNATFLDKKEKVRKSLGGRLKRLVLDVVLLYVVLPRKINFTQMEKYGKHTEKTYRDAFCTVIDWFHANFSLLMQVSKPTDRLANAIDPSYISKSGKQTPWTGKFWSGCASSAKWGLEILGIAALNIDQHDAFALKAVQTPDTKTLEKAGLSLYKWYADVIVRYEKELMYVSKYIVADAAFSKDTFINVIMEHGFQLKTKVFFSTDTEMSGEDVIAYYRTRFQIEFCFRDAKEFTGLCDCQARSKDKLDFAFNASLFAVNAAKVFRYKSDRSISMSTFKSLMVNQYLCKRIFSMSGFRPNMRFIKMFNQALVEFQLDAC